MPHGFQKVYFLISAVLLTNPGLFSEEPVLLEFHQIPGMVLHAESQVDESVYINGYLSHQAEIDEYSVVSVLDISSDGSALLKGEFRTVDRILGLPGVMEWTESETVRMKRTAQGLLTVPDDAALPVQRSIPRFPGSPVSVGDSWSLEAEEQHMFRIRGLWFGPYRGPVQVRYELTGLDAIDGVKTARIGISYDLYLPVRQPGEPVRLVSGRSRQTLFWDIANGQPVRKEESFEFLMVLSDGTIQEFIGSGITQYRMTNRLDRGETARQMENLLGELPGLVVEQDEQGVILFLDETDHILFEPDSAVIAPGQMAALERLSSVLEDYADRDLLITGHTADYGSPEGRKELSRKRAAAVADALFPDGRSGPGRLFLRGAGSSEPVGSDRENRRVEILILD